MRENTDKKICKHEHFLGSEILIEYFFCQKFFKPIDLIMFIPISRFSRTCYTDINEECIAKSTHCVKSVRIRSFSGPHLPAFGTNMEF